MRSELHISRVLHVHSLRDTTCSHGTRYSYMTVVTLQDFDESKNFRNCFDECKNLKIFGPLRERKILPPPKVHIFAERTSRDTTYVVSRM